MPHIIAYTYEADFHCVEHSEERFPILAPAYLPLIERFGWAQPKDNEGNEVHPVFDSEEWEYVPTCPECLRDYKAGKIATLPRPEVNLIQLPD